MDAVLRDVVAWVDRARGSLLVDIDLPVIFKFDPQNLPVLEFVLSSDTVDPMALRQLAETDLAYRFVGTAGVATVSETGRVTAIGTGSATITVTAAGDATVSARTTVTVQPAAP